jgi:hypothetical protein
MPCYLPERLNISYSEVGKIYFHSRYEFAGNKLLRPVQFKSKVIAMPFINEHQVVENIPVKTQAIDAYVIPSFGN